MKIAISTPVPPRSRKGNGVTARRWARILRSLGHRVTLAENGYPPGADLLVALHARRSAGVIARFAAEHPDRPRIVALTGTDLYEDIRSDPGARRSLELATDLIVLQEQGILELPLPLRSRVRVIPQSVRRIPRPPQPVQGCFRVCVIGHLRPVKDPFRTALASRLLPSSSRIQVIQVGAALTDEMRATAKREMAINPRYQWRGEVPHARALRWLASSHLLSLTSRMEGGANVIFEALAHGVPVISSRIAGSIGILGQDYPGYFPIGDTQALAGLLERAETVPVFHGSLVTACRAVSHLAEPATERRCWEDLLAGLGAAREGNHGDAIPRPIEGGRQ